jgi:cyclic peptide transporter
MPLILLLLKASWRTVVLACLVGAVSGAASVALVAIILAALRAPAAATWSVCGLFAALCAVVLSTRIGSQLLLSRLAKNTVSRLRIGMSRRILQSPLKHLEEVGAHRLQTTLTNDVNVVSQALNGIPVLGVNVVVLFCGAIYLATLSPGLLLGAVVFAVLGVASYWYSSRFAQKHVRRSREEQDVQTRHIQTLIDGIKELKMHHNRRRAFLEQLTASEVRGRESKFLADSLYDAAVNWGRLTFFIAIGLLLFAWPRFSPVDSATLTAYALTILYLMSPLEQIVAWLPFLAWAASSVKHIERLGLLLDQREEEGPGPEAISQWREIELKGVTHEYRPDGQLHGFVLGPIDLALRAGETVFVIGGNGSGKTTLGKILTSLYLPDAGEVLLDGKPITSRNRESYRQLFATVFDDAMIFDTLWGLDAAGLDERARGYLRLLQLDKVVTVQDGVLSSTQVSRGQRKRLALLTACLEDRPIYVFDEWAADQDPVFRKIFYLSVLPDLKRRGKTVVAITHDDRYFEHADRVIKLEEGRITAGAADPLHHPAGN